MKSEPPLKKRLKIWLIGILMFLPLSVYAPKDRHEEITPVLIQENSLIAQGISSSKPRAIVAVVTAYNPVVWQTDSTPHITASGETVREGIIACPKWLPFGTIVRIDGELYVCEDRMNARYQNLAYFDILMWSYHEAKNWGVKVKEIEIL